MDKIKENDLENIAGGNAFSIKELADGQYTVVGESQVFSDKEKAQKWLKDFTRTIKKAVEDD